MDMVAIVLGFVVFFVLTLFATIIILLLYFWSVLLAGPLHLNKWFLFFGTAGLLIGLFIIREKKCYRRELQLARHLNNQHQIEIQSVSARISCEPSKERFENFLQILAHYEYIVIFQLFQDQVEALNLTKKCKRIDKEIWTAQKSDISEKLPELWEGCSGDGSLKFLIHTIDTPPINPQAFYRNSKPNKFGLSAGAESVASGLWLSERLDKDMVFLIFGEDMGATFVYRQATTIGVAEIIESVVENHIPMPT